MPSAWRRIAVRQDPPLTDALESVAAFYPATPPAQVVHDLAIKGAAAVVREQVSREDALERLVQLSTERSDDTVDWDVLERIDELAWSD